MTLEQDIVGWIRARQAEEPETYPSCIAHAFGVVILRDGEKAQIQVKLQINKEEWFK